MEGSDVVRAMIRWVHAVAAVAWIGGSIFYLVVLRPALAGSDGAHIRAALEPRINQAFRDLVDVSIIALIVTGVVITVDRLSSGPIPTVYFVILGLKIATAVSMFFLARDLGTRLGRLTRSRGAPPAQREPSLAEPLPSRRGWRRQLSPSRAILILGLVAFFLSMLLVHAYERGVAGL